MPDVTLPTELLLQGDVPLTKEFLLPDAPLPPEREEQLWLLLPEEDCCSGEGTDRTWQQEEPLPRHVQEQLPLPEPLNNVVRDRLQPRKQLLPRKEQLLLHKRRGPQQKKLK